MDSKYPTPWSVADIEHDYDIIDADGKVAARAAHGDRELAAFIVEAVNAIYATLKLQRTLLGWSMERDRLREERDKLDEVAASLQRSRDAALAEAERLRNALVMFAEEWDNYAAEEGIRAPAWSSLFRSFARSCREAAGEDTP